MAKIEFENKQPGDLLTAAEVNEIKQVVNDNDPADNPGPKGDPGDPGADGKELEVRKNETHIQTRLGSDGTWTDLIALADLIGPAGADGSNGTDGSDGADGNDGANGQEVSLQKTETHIQWRLGTGSWTNLVALEDIAGPSGDQGEQGEEGPEGPQGIQGEKGDQGDPGEDVAKFYGTFSTYDALPSDKLTNGVEHFIQKED